MSPRLVHTTMPSSKPDLLYSSVCALDIIFVILLVMERIAVICVGVMSRVALRFPVTSLEFCAELIKGQRVTKVFDYLVPFGARERARKKPDTLNGVPRRNLTLDFDILYAEARKFLPNTQKLHCHFTRERAFKVVGDPAHRIRVILLPDLGSLQCFLKNSVCERHLLYISGVQQAHPTEHARKRSKQLRKLASYNVIEGTDLAV